MSAGLTDNRISSREKTKRVRIILWDLDPEDLILAVRAATWLLGQSHKDAILAYGERPNTKDFYVRRNKSSITVRSVGRVQ